MLRSGRLLRPLCRRGLATTSQKIEAQSLDAKETAIRYGFGAVVSPLYLIGLGWFDVPKNHVRVLSCWGKYYETVSEGLHFRVPIGMSGTTVFTAQKSHKLPASKVVDKMGNPIIVSGIVNYRIVNPEKFVFNINQDEKYIHNQSEAVLKRVVAKYPYDSRDDQVVSLKNETDEVNSEMKVELEKLVEKAGVEVEQFYLTDMNYAPEISQQMLIRQQARAYIDAKNEISQAGVQIVKDTMAQLKGEGLEVTDPKARDQLVNNLLTVIASGNNVQPTMPLNSNN